VGGGNYRPRVDRAFEGSSDINQEWVNRERSRLGDICWSLLFIRPEVVLVSPIPLPGDRAGDGSTRFILPGFDWPSALFYEMVPHII
jgi:hypothetical protein